MPEKIAIHEQSQMGFESAWGTAVPGNLRPQSFSLRQKSEGEYDVFKAVGDKYPSLVVPGPEWTGIGIEGRMTYNEILWLLALGFGEPTPSLLGTTAYKWTFNPPTRGSNSALSATVEQGDAVTAWRAAGVNLVDLEWTVNRRQCLLSGQALGKAIETGITLTAAPDTIPLVPVLPAHCSVKIADTQAGLAGATALTRGYAFNWKVSGLHGMSHPIGSNDVMVEQDPSMKAKLKLAADTIGLGLYTKMRAGDTKWLRLACIGSLIETSYYYTIQLDLPLKVSEAPSEPASEKGIQTLEWSCDAVHDDTWGKAMDLQITNTMDALE